MESKRQLALGTALIVLFFVLYRFPDVTAFLARVLAIVSPFVAGACLAFILDIPARWLERLLARGRKKPFKAARPVSVAVVVVAAMLLVAGVVLLALPEIVRAVNIIIEFIPEAIAQINTWLARDDMAWLRDVIPTLELPQDQTAVQEQFQKLTQYLLYGLTASTSAISFAVQGVWSGLLALLSAIYMLLSKRQLCEHARRLIGATMQKERAQRLHKNLALSRGIFTEFVEGQALMVPVTGILVFVGMLILGIPSAALVSVLSGAFAIIPLFGAIFAWVMGALLVVMQSPIDAVWYSCLFVVTQIVTGNIIYPRVIGNSVGLPPLWTLVAVTVGGGLMGVTGMLLFVPLAGVCYALAREKITQKEAALKAQ